MSEHWRPDEEVVRARFGAGRRLLEEFVPPEFLGRMQRVERQLPVGAKAGLLLVAAACVGVAAAMYQAFVPHDAVAEESQTRTLTER